MMADRKRGKLGCDMFKISQWQGYISLTVSVAFHFLCRGSCRLIWKQGSFFCSMSLTLQEFSSSMPSILGKTSLSALALRFFVAATVIHELQQIVGWRWMGSRWRGRAFFVVSFKGTFPSKWATVGCLLTFCSRQKSDNRNASFQGNWPPKGSSRQIWWHVRTIARLTVKLAGSPDVDDVAPR